MDGMYLSAGKIARDGDVTDIGRIPAGILIEAVPPHGIHSG